MKRVPISNRDRGKEGKGVCRLVASLPVLRKWTGCLV
jgi:hypothetical protein